MIEQSLTTTGASEPARNGTHCPRYERLHRLRGILGDSDGVSIGELAQITSTSLRTVYRDLRALQHAGCPVCQTHGIYRITPGTKSAKPPVTLRKSDMVALVLAVLANRTLELQPFHVALENLTRRLVLDLERTGDYTVKGILLPLLARASGCPSDSVDASRSIDRHFLAVCHWIRRGRMCRVTYVTRADEVREAALRFTQLLPASGRWFALAIDNASQPIRVEVTRICSITEVSKLKTPEAACHPATCGPNGRKNSRKKSHAQRARGLVQVTRQRP